MSSYIDFKNGHAAEVLVGTIEHPCDKTVSAVQMNGSTREWFRTTVGVRQEWLLTPILFSIFFDLIMSDALEEHDGKIAWAAEILYYFQYAGP